MAQIDDIREKLVECARQIELSVAAQRAEHEENEWSKDIPFERMRDTTGRFLSASIYADLGMIYAAIAQIDLSRN